MLWYNIVLASEDSCAPHHGHVPVCKAVGGPIDGHSDSLVTQNHYVPIVSGTYVLEGEGEHDAVGQCDWFWVCQGSLAMVCFRHPSKVTVELLV